ncbi:MAG TPA: WD40 repeat domain-containing protein, partial [Ktedonobacteraceae bacterium]|nr:WD40 repeat domain-containing protein [Ktedonobacteraceae bacterium]
GKMVASGSADKTVQVWRAADGALLYTYYGYESPVTSIVWATDRTNEIASAGENDGTVQIWDALLDHTYLNWQGDGRVLALAWQENSPWIASGGTDREIYTWNAQTGDKGASYRGHRGDVRAISWFPGMVPLATPGHATPKAVISGGADGTVQAWDATNGKHIFTYGEHAAGVNGLTLIRRSSAEQVTAIASASDDGTVRVWFPYNVAYSSTQLNTKYVYHGHEGKVNAVASLFFSSYYYGLSMVSASDDHTVQVWSISGRPILTYRQHQTPVKALATSPVDHRVVSGDESGQIHLWTVEGLTY